MVKRNCVICNKEFFTYPYYIKNGWGKCCSYKCSVKSRTLKRVKLICKGCGSPFDIRPKLKKYNIKFCTFECFNKYVRKNGPWNFQGHVDRTCANDACKKVFRINKAKLNKKEGKYCSMQCQWDTRTLFKREKNGAWRGGVSFEPYTHEFNASLKFMIRERFNFRCVECGSEEIKQKHAIHHVDFNKKNNRLNNFFPLCDPCHKVTFHRPDIYIPYFKQKMKLFNSFHK